MDSFSRSSGFRFNPNSNTIFDAYRDSEFSGILEIYVHHARNIRNICIYDNQDVYAKFSLTYNPDHTHSTRIINGGGKDLEFNENLMMRKSLKLMMSSNLRFGCLVGLEITWKNSFWDFLWFQFRRLLAKEKSL
ncbi:hypothetical protein REPUB_Repub04eG0159500 [Reevesia pubescens]